MASTLRAPLAAAGRAAALLLAIAGTTVIAAGWLYWARAGAAGWPGPQVPDALPLDELAGHDQTPLVIFGLAYAGAGAALGLLARALRLDRLTAGLTLAAGTAAWLFSVDAVSLLVVRQVPAGVALREAAGMQPVYLAATVTGAAGALLGRAVTRHQAVPVVLTWLVAGGGLLDLASAVVPHLHLGLGLRMDLVERIGPTMVRPLAHALLAPAGALLLIAARGLARGNRRAWLLATGLLWFSAVLHLLRGPGFAGAAVTALAAVALLARRQDFPFRGDPAAHPPALLRLASMLALAMVYGLAALFTYAAVAGVTFGLAPALADTARALAGLPPPGARYLPGAFSRWFPLSVLSVAAVGVIWAAEVWVRPWRQRLSRSAGRVERAQDIVATWGADTLAPFTLRSDKEWFITGQTLIAYRVVRGVALISGDPVGPPGQAAVALAEFLGHARSRGWRAAVLGASGELGPVYRELGLHPVYHGDEAVIDVGGFSLAGRPMRAARQGVHRVGRHGYHAEVLRAGDVPPPLRQELADTEAAWLRGRFRKGFAMELDDLFRLDGDAAVFVIGRDEQDRVAGFLHLAVCPASRSLSLSSMPRRPGTPNGFDAWLVVNAVSWARAQGLTRLSLNFSPFAGLLDSEAVLSSGQRLERAALLRLKPLLALQLDNLLRFNRQFSPGWLARYVVVGHWADLPRVAVAAMAAEGYLPHAGLVRGDARHPGTDAVPAAGGPPATGPGTPGHGDGG